MTDAVRSTQETVTLLTGGASLAALWADLASRGPVHGWIYLLDYDFLKRQFSVHLDHSPLRLIVDWKHRAPAKTATLTWPNFEAWHWSYNRTMHDKTLIFPALNVLYIGTHNLTRGSYWLSLNRSVRIESQKLTQELMQQWQEDKNRAVKITFSTT